ncbi:MAG: Bax inhibitor-1/YccA family protein [Clostridia bacterium]|nr:Bax inhibitor-1/YccA family protein [Clostridia bacterium]
MENEVDNKFFTKTFFWMFLGLIGTAIVAAYTYYSELWVNIILSGSLPIVAIAELIAVIVFGLLFRKMSPTVAGIVYFIYAFLNGVTLSTVFALYELNSIVLIFIATAAVFGVLAFIGYKTNKDLTNWRTILYTILIIGIIASLVNLFMNNPMLDLGLTWLILFIFFGITIYDMNKLKMLSQDPELNPGKLYIYGALELYLDFINIFLRLLRLFAKVRD